MATSGRNPFPEYHEVFSKDYQQMYYLPMIAMIRNILLPH